MGSNKFLGFLIVFLLCFQIVLAGDVVLYRGSGPESICPSSTDLFSDVIENTGSEPIDVSVSSSGTASVFSTTVPQGFVLAPGEIKNIFTYITPSSSTNVGQYTLNIMANSESLTHFINVLDCFEYFFTALNPEKHICPCESEDFDFEIQNNGQYVETYTLSVEGTYPGTLSLSESIISIAPSESKTFHTYIDSNCDSLGDYEFTIVATPVTGGVVRSVSSKLVVDPCYDFRLETEKDSASFCEHSQETIAISVFNEGTTSNIFELDLDGPAWANLDKNSLNIGAGEAKSANLVLAPEYGVQGNFEIELTASPDKGNVQALNIFNVNIKKCHAVSVDIERSSDTMCNSLENSYVVNVINNGEYAKEYYLELDAPDWVSIDKRSLSLGVGGEEQVILTVNPSYNVIPATYSVKLSAQAKDSSQVADFDKIDIVTVTREECYKVLIGVEEDSIDVYYDSGATVPIIIENIGSDTTSYEISLTGTASSFVYLNPSIVTLGEAKSELLYLYVAPTGEILPGDYEVSISVRLEDSTILASEKVKINVKEGTGEILVETEEKVSIFDRILIFFRELFGSPKEVEEELEVVEEIEEIEEIEEVEEVEEVEEEVVEKIEEIEEEINDTIEEINETVVNETTEEFVDQLIAPGDIIEFKIGGEIHTLSYEDRSADAILILISSTPVYVSLGEGEEREIDLDGDGLGDIRVVFNGFIDDKADISYEVLVDELIPGMEEVEEELEYEDILEEEIEEEEKEPFFSSFVSASKNIFGKFIEDVRTYRTHLITIIVVLIIILLGIRTDLFKKIKKFFEEEIEEEEPVIIEEESKKEVKKEVSKEEKKPKKEEKPKKEVKKEETEEDEEDFIIEFDNEKVEK